MRYLLVIMVFAACSHGAETKIKPQEGLMDLTDWFIAEAKRLNALQPGIVKNIQRGEKLETIEADSLNWNDEFAPFLALNNATAKYSNQFEKKVDTSGPLEMITYTCKDTTLEIQQVFTTRAGGRLEIIQVTTRERSWIVDRDKVLTYQPGRGYRIEVKEDYLWNSPTTTEIFVVFSKAEFK